jgi:hypothetical protein
VTAASIDAALATHAPDVENDRIGVRQQQQQQQQQQRQ